MLYYIINSGLMVKFVIVLIIFLLFDVWAAQHSWTLLRFIEHIIIDETPLYDANNAATTQRFSAVHLMTIIMTMTMTIK